MRHEFHELTLRKPNLNAKALPGQKAPRTRRTQRNKNKVKNVRQKTSSHRATEGTKKNNRILPRIHTDKHRCKNKKLNAEFAEEKQKQEDRNKIKELRG